MADHPMAVGRRALDRPEPSPKDRVLLVGNPNVGKSLLFGLLSHTYVAVSNYPGTTVEIARGTLRGSRGRSEVLDTPGINTLLPTSEDEKVTRDLLLEESFRAVLQVGDSKNLRRALLMTVELAEMDLPMVLCLNMGDEAARAGLQIDGRELSRILAVPCVETVGVRREGIRELRAALDRPGLSALTIRYPAELERAVAELEVLLPESGVTKRSLALMLLAGDETLTGWLHRSLPAAAVGDIRRARAQASRSFGEPLRLVIQRARLRAVNSILHRVQRNGQPTSSALGEVLDRASMHPIWGVPILVAVLAGLFGFVGWFGAGIAVDFLETSVFGAWVNPAVERFCRTFIPFPLVQDLLIGPYGVLTMALTYALAIILPIVVTFFLAFGILEDSGYLPRLTVIVNRVFRIMGLNGKAVLPMVLGLGCDTMATLTTRILETRRERVIVTLLLALAVPCSAQLGVILGLLAGLSWIAAAIWVGTVFATLMLVGWLSSRILPGQSSDFILEIPPLRWPRPANLLAKTLGRLEWYLREAVPLFVVGTLVLFGADRVGLLARAEAAFSPLVVRLLDLPSEVTQVFLMGFLRRDFGAAGLFRMSHEGALTPLQILVALVVITLFIPCVANFLMILKERGWRTALAIAGFILPFALLVGAAMNWALRGLGVTL